MATTISDLVRTMSSYFRIGAVRVKDSSGVLQAKNAADSAFVDMAGKQIRVQGNNATNAIVLNAANSLGSTVTFTLPSADGSTGQFIKTDGSGNLAFASSTSNADLTESQAFTEASSSPVTIFTPPANAIIREIIVEVTAAAAAGTPTLDIGISGDTDLYAANTLIDLKEVATYIITVMVSAGGTPEPIIATLVPDSQNFTGVIYVVYTNPS